MKNLQVWIPAQINSTRVKEKNIRPFSNKKSLLEIKILQIKESLPKTDIYISGNDNRVKSLCKRMGCRFIKRPTSLTGNKIQQKNLFEHFLKTTPTSKYVMWIQVTDPFFKDFKTLLKTMPKIDESIVVCSEQKKHAFYKHEPINFNFGDWHTVTQDIEPIMIPRWSTFLMQRETIKKYKYHFALENKFFVTEEPLVDIDTMDDFRLAQQLYELRNVT